MRSNQRSFVVCADDYGMTPGIDRAILKLANERRISAIGCLVGTDHWSCAAAALRKLDRLDVGLHLNLTEGRAISGASRLAADGSFGGRSRLALGALTGFIDEDSLRREMEAQLARFVDGMDRYPDFVDGHQSIQLYPVIGSVIIRFILEWKGPRRRPWLRTCCDRTATILRRKHSRFLATAAAIGSIDLVRAAQRFGIEVNDSFSGFYDVAQAEHFSKIFPSFLIGLRRRHVVMCHPGLCESDTERRDVWMRCREHEFEFFSNGEYLALLNSHGLEVTQFNNMADMPGANLSP